MTKIEASKVNQEEFDVAKGRDVKCTSKDERKEIVTRTEDEKGEVL